MFHQTVARPQHVEDPEKERVCRPSLTHHRYSIAQPAAGNVALCVVPERLIDRVQLRRYGDVSLEEKISRRVGNGANGQIRA